MWTSQSGQIIALSPHRVQTLLAFARRAGKARLLGVPLGHCGDCTVNAVAKRIGHLARSARATGTQLGNAGERYTVFDSTALGPRHRLITRLGSDGRYHVVWLDGSPADALPGTSLGELELEAEDAVQRRGLRTTLRWTDTALTRKTASDRYARRDAVYIMVVLEPGSTLRKPIWKPVKVGLTTNAKTRFKEYTRYPNARYFVGVLEGPITTRAPGQVLPTIEHAVARAIRRVAQTTTTSGLPPDLDLSIHKKPINPLRATGRIEIGNILPPALMARYPMRDMALATRARAPGALPFDAVPLDAAMRAGRLGIPRGRLFETPVLSP